jgi:tRNA(fMet)-specific endonuclease VapC
MIIIDTIFLIDIIKNNPEAIEKYKNIINNEQEACIAALSITEIILGLSSIHAKKDEETRILDIINNSHIIAITKEIAMKAEYIEKSPIESGNRIGVIDAIIASSALLYIKKLITEKIRHFEKVSELQVENY